MPLPITGAFAFIVISFCFLYKNRPGFALFFLFLAALVLRVWAAHLDPFLHNWDERFHALVARNMMDDPFHPMLKKTPVSNELILDWCCSNVWLHKQPLFMWQMALSMKMFGVSEFAIRYPAALQGALLVPMIYRIAQHLMKDKYLSFIAAVFVCFSSYHLELISGAYAADQNDAVFLFYIVASIWAYSEYINSNRKMQWAIVIGLFAGAAILTKWLTGLLVYSAWGITILMAIGTQEGRKEIKYYLASLLTCSICFVPWQIYIWKVFPVYARHEHEFNIRHLTERIEETQSDYGYYIGNLDLYFGYDLWIALIIGIVLLIVKYRSRLTFSLIFYVVLTFSFFSVVKSQSASFVFIVVPIGFIFIAASMSIFVKHKYLRYMVVLLVILGGNNVFNYKAMSLTHSNNDVERLAKINNASIYRSLSDILPAGYNLVLNTEMFDDVNVMFYNNDITAYPWCLNDGMLDSLMKENVPIAAFQSHQEYGLNDRLNNYDRFFKINKALK